ncbi:Peroxisome proliferator-activated receptor gamma coactivator 1-beta like [Actinidia chinensis var. chinensis]|uniref:Peroxisome proliferator-activated receptor gamma coactivator 1-beta like n=1 Tax=Actinidia chinensis var. chinensis TaxID=1590841 RepID=A0A2R6R5N4_ACTCC|nr:Peroxisome proliferator-activated receptor gamma coactivator 1-beta like [Actinidia chinensis var. chinensis]
MLPLKLVRSLVLGEAINNPPFLVSKNHQHHDHDLPHNDNDSDCDSCTTSSNGNPHRAHHNHTISSLTRTKTKNQIPFLLFMPTTELVTDTYRLAQLARDIGMDLYPNPSLSHIILSWPSSSPSPSASSHPSLWSSTSLSSSSSSSSWSLPNDAVPLPFPSLAMASLSHLRFFVSLSRGFFKLVFSKSTLNPLDRVGHRASTNWDCCSVSLISRRTGVRIDSMDGFSRTLAGMGWTLFRTNLSKNPSSDSGINPVLGANSVFLFRKSDSSRVRTEQASGNGSNDASGQCRVRELRLPPLDFSNAPLRILQYILLMTDDIFYLA